MSPLLWFPPPNQSHQQRHDNEHEDAQRRPAGEDLKRQDHLLVMGRGFFTVVPVLKLTGFWAHLEQE